MLETSKLLDLDIALAYMIAARQENFHHQAESGVMDLSSLSARLCEKPEMRDWQCCLDTDAGMTKPS
jgi:hypothetical protein